MTMILIRLALGLLLFVLALVVVSTVASDRRRERRAEKALAELDALAAETRAFIKRSKESSL